MSSWLSTTKAAALLSTVQLNPEIGTDDSEFVTDVVSRAARWLAKQLGFDRYPESAQGYSLSGTGASTDISSESTNTLLVSVDNDSSFQEITLTLGSLTSGSAIATELQTQIQAVDQGAYKFVTVTYDSDDDTYEITSPTYGEDSAINVSYDDDYEHVVNALKLGPVWGGWEYPGADPMPEFDDMVVAIVQHWYNEVGVEGMRSFSIPGDGSYTKNDIPPQVQKYIHSQRRMF